jgi:NAD(P)-dependent dehydrogenase (short-subunit alcohol dehydrogenase family)
MLLADRVAIVSGVGPGVGRSAALRLAQEGAKVVLSCRGVEKAEAIAAEVRELGGDVLVRSCDVTQPEQCQALVDATVEAFGRLDVLVNNAFATGKMKPLMKADVAASWRTPFEVNVYGTLDLSQRAALTMNDGGSIIMIGTQSALVPEPGLGSYGASKAALAAASQGLATELGPRAIRVNTVVPSHIDGPNLRFWFKMEAERRNIEEEEVCRDITALGLLPHICTSDEVAGAVLFFASDLSSAVTGQSLRVNCGQLLS